MAECLNEIYTKEDRNYFFIQSLGETGGLKSKLVILVSPSGCIKRGCFRLAIPKKQNSPSVNKQFEDGRNKKNTLFIQPHIFDLKFLF